jgi:hypothetical protein
MLQINIWKGVMLGEVTIPKQVGSHTLPVVIDRKLRQWCNNWTALQVIGQKMNDELDNPHSVDSMVKRSWGYDIGHSWEKPSVVK